MGGKRELYTMILTERVEHGKRRMHDEAGGQASRQVSGDEEASALEGDGTAKVQSRTGERKAAGDKHKTPVADSHGLELLEEDAYVEGWLAAACDVLESVRGLFKEPRIAVEALFDHMVMEEGDAFIDALLTYSGFSDEWKEDEGCVDELGEWKFDDTPAGRAREEAFMAAWERESNRDLGDRGEEAAARCLEGKGYEILERKYTCDYGEADIIALDPHGVVVFIEVKTRRSMRAGFPEEAITATKRKRYERIAIEYMTHSDWEDGTQVRFDAVGICVQGNGRAMLRHHIGFFDACD